MEIEYGFGCKIGNSDLKLAIDDNSGLSRTNGNKSLIYMKYLSEHHNVSLVVRNNDNYLCPPVRYTYNISIPSNWEYTCNFQELLVNPRDTCKIDCNIYIPYNEEYDEEKTLYIDMEGESVFHTNRQNNSIIANYISPIDCIDSNPDINMQISSLNQAHIVSVEIINYDTPACDNMILSYEIYSSSEDSLYSSNNIDISPLGNYKYNVPVLEENINSLYMVVKILGKEDILLKANTSYAIFTPSCIDKKFNMSLLGSETISLDMRMSKRILIQIDPLKNCLSKIQCAATSSNTDVFTTALLPLKSFYLNGNIQYLLVQITSSNFVESNFTGNAHISCVSNSGDYSNSIDIPVEIFPKKCDKGILQNVKIGISSTCDTTLDIDTSPIDNFDCTIKISSNLPWFCGNSLFDISIEEKNFTYIIGNAIMNEVIPSNSTTIPMSLFFRNYQNFTDEKIDLDIKVKDLRHTDIPEVYHKSSVYIGKCVVNNISLYTSVNMLTLAVGQHGRYPFIIEGNETKYCLSKPKHKHYIDNYDVNRYKEMGIDVSLAGIHVSKKNTVFSIYLVTGELYVNNGTIDDIHNITVIASDSRVNHTERNTIHFRINSNCTYITPLLEFDPEKIKIAVGDATNNLVELNITNKNIGSCPTTSFHIGGSISGSKLVGHGVSASLSVRNPVKLKSQESITVPVHVKTLQMLDPGDFELQIEAKNNIDSSHSSSATFKLEVGCPAPRPIWDFQIQEIYSLGIPTGNELSWHGCETAADCCCPCSFIIERNGEKISETLVKRSFTDKTTLSQIAMGTTYKITVKDRNGVLSSSETCSNTITVFRESSSNEILIVLLIVACILACPLLVALLEQLRFKKFNYQLIWLDAEYQHEVKKAKRMKQLLLQRKQELGLLDDEETEQVVR
eukprot:TRINITY_DN7649_c0_g1_i1.p1 TRINITY_DN7649_c0_g1~~TRINITY_DN7649_c0_g1_i1.p1  ORF type:complete len:970 (-),score=156.46 TRINITY_DN7649_c0_g1_i1:25-2736(-)